MAAPEHVPAAPPAPRSKGRASEHHFIYEVLPHFDYNVFLAYKHVYEVNDENPAWSRSIVVSLVTLYNWYNSWLMYGELPTDTAARRSKEMRRAKKAGRQPPRKGALTVEALACLKAIVDSDPRAYLDEICDEMWEAGHCWAESTNGRALVERLQYTLRIFTA